jgi:hypothetical protein
VGVLHAVAIAIGAEGIPRAGDELHRADRPVPARVAVVPALISVADGGHARAAVEHRAEDLAAGDAARVDPATARVR